MVTQRQTSLRGSLRDNDMDVINQAGIVISQNKIVEVGSFADLKAKFPTILVVEYMGPKVILPSFIDAHTHICFAGSRAKDFAMRNSGLSYLEIAKAGGGIWDTVTKTRMASQEDLESLMHHRIERLISQGITTVEVKSGYGLSIIEELKMLYAIKTVAEKTAVDLIPTCLAAHIKPRDFEGSHEAYLDLMSAELFPVLKEQNLTNRVDIFIEEEAFGYEISKGYLQKAQAMGFDITIHADQFNTGGSALAVELNARSADHLEASGIEEIRNIATSDTVAMALPGASLGIGCAFTPARQILDHGGILAIASDWNPGSAPMGESHYASFYISLL